MHPSAGTIAHVVRGQPQQRLCSVQPGAVATCMLATKCAQAEFAALNREIEKLHQGAERSTATAAWAVKTAELP